MSDLFVFDTSALINPWARHYRRANFPKYWRLLEKVISDGVVISHTEVHEEIKRQDDELLDWAEERKEMFQATDESIEMAMSDLVVPVYRGHQRFRSDSVAWADPWVIALALTREAIVVSAEELSSSKSQSRKKIPQACIELEVTHLLVADFIEVQNWQFD